MGNARAKEVSFSVRQVMAVLLCLFSLFAMLSPPVLASAVETGKVVRVGWFDSSYNIKDALDRRSGYCYDYQRKIAAYTGWKYEYVEGSWVELMQKLENGEIDMLGGVSYTKERAERMLFPSYAMAAQEYYLYIAADQIDAFNEDFSYFNGKRIGVNRGTVQVGLFRKWAKTHQLSAELVELSSAESKSVEMLTNGEHRLLEKRLRLHRQG